MARNEKLGINITEELDCIKNEMHKPGHPITRFMLSKTIVWMIWIFFKLGIPPNAITVIKIIVSLGAGAVLALCSGWESALLAAFGVYLSECLDYSDGCVARLTGKTSNFGAWFDVMAENGAFLFYFFGAAIGWRQIDPNAPAWIVLSLLLAIRWFQQLSMSFAHRYFAGGGPLENIFTDVGGTLKKFRMPIKYFVFGLDMQSMFVLFFILIMRLDLMLYFFCIFYGGIAGVTCLQVFIRGLKR